MSMLNPVAKFLTLLLTQRFNLLDQIWQVNLIPLVVAEKHHLFLRPSVEVSFV
jgi:hypothetical protein